MDRFTAHAADYVAGRPSYPAAVLEMVLHGLGAARALTVVDLGAGTGISSRLLASSGATVIAVEPNPAMRGRAAPAATLRWSDGTAEDTGLAAAAADLVTAFQAFHWFDREAAPREILRIARPGARVALVYNERDEQREPFTRDYGELVRRFALDETEQSRSAARVAFAAYSGWRVTETSEIANHHSLDRAGLHARIRSTSYLPDRGAAATRLRAEADALFDKYATDETVTMRIKTSVSLASADAR